MEECKRIRRELMHHGVIVDFYKDTMQMPNGHEVDWDLISHKGAAAVVAVRNDGRLFMVRQYRNPLERMTLELPAGALNFREEPPGSLRPPGAGRRNRLYGRKNGTSDRYFYNGGFLR